jgi:thiamine pyrophosphokinase
MPTLLHLNDFLLPDLLDYSVDYHLVIVNSPSYSVELTRRFWKICKIKICADGGGNRLYDSLTESERLNYIPTAIVGDLDSLRPEVSVFYRYRSIFYLFLELVTLDFSSHNGQVIRDTDQNSNDLDKSLRYLERAVEEQEHGSSEDELENEGHNCTVLIIGGSSGGRLDQGFANIHALYIWKKIYQRLILIDDINICHLLQEGYHHCIRPIREKDIYEAKYCALIPLGHPISSITTRGLEWDLRNEPLDFSSRISTSNTIPSSVSEVIVECSDSVLWISTWKPEKS